jgi:hypothetical protein
MCEPIEPMQGLWLMYHCIIALTIECRAGKNNFVPGSTTWRQEFPADQRSIFIQSLHVHKRIMF